VSTKADQLQPPALDQALTDAAIGDSALDAMWPRSLCAVGTWQISATYVSGTCTKALLGFDKTYAVAWDTDRYRVDEENGAAAVVDAFERSAGSCYARFHELPEESRPSVDLAMALTAEGEEITGEARMTIGTADGSCAHTFEVVGNKSISRGGK
jgi:hypothetical protein